MRGASASRRRMAAGRQPEPDPADGSCPDLRGGAGHRPGKSLLICLLHHVDMARCLFRGVGQQGSAGVLGIAAWKRRYDDAQGSSRRQTSFVEKSIEI